LIVAALIAFTALGLLLPGTRYEILATGIAIGDLIVAAGSLGIVSTLIWAGPEIRNCVVESLAGPTEVVEDAAAIARYLVVFVAVLIAHWGFAPVLGPLLELPWAYDLGFLLLALIPLAVVAYRLYNSLDPLATLVTDGLVEDRDRHRVTEESGSP
jgi:hypothetical protein